MTRTVVDLYGLSLVLRRGEDAGALVKLLHGAMRVERDYTTRRDSGDNECEYFVEETVTIRIMEVRNDLFKRRPGKADVVDLFSMKPIGSVRRLRAIGNGGAS